MAISSRLVGVQGACVGADILETTNWLPKELQDSLLRLVKSSDIVNLDATGKTRPKQPLHYDGAGERLRLTTAG